MIYTDGYWMVADTEKELRAFAKQMGMSQQWYRAKPAFGYFEVFGNMRKAILRTAGVVHVSLIELTNRGKVMEPLPQKTCTACPAGGNIPQQPTAQGQP